MSEMEDRLRRALTQRAGQVEPSAGDIDAVVARATDAHRSHRRRRMFLSAAAVVAVVAAVAGAFALNEDGQDQQVATVDDPTTTTAPTTTSTSSTTLPPPVEDDGTPGWPGFTSRVFDDPQAAALAFVTDVLGFAEPTLAGSGMIASSEGGTERFFTYTSRPTAGIATDVTVHDTGVARGWVVIGVTSEQGTIDDVRFDGSTASLSGVASAFEATVTIQLLDQEGNVLAESFTMAGSNGDLGPYEDTIDLGPQPIGTPFWVMVSEADASGDGDTIWATTARLAI